MKPLSKNIKKRIAYLRLMAGDTDAFGFFYDEYAKKIYSYVMFRTSDTELSQDITHDVFLQAWQYIQEKKSIHNLQAFIYRMAHNKIVDFYRLKDRTPVLLPEDHPSKVDHQAESEIKGDIQLLRQRIKLLKDEYQNILTLRHIEGLSIDEISDVLGKDKNNVRVLLHRAFIKLQSLYHESSDDTQDNQN